MNSPTSFVAQEFFGESLAQKSMAGSIAFFATFVLFTLLSFLLHQTVKPPAQENPLKIHLENQQLPKPPQIKKPIAIQVDEFPVDQEVPLDIKNFIPDFFRRIPQKKRSDAAVQGETTEKFDPKLPQKKLRTEPDASSTESQKKVEIGVPQEDSVESPIFFVLKPEQSREIRLVEPEESAIEKYEKPEDFIPDEIRKTLRGKKPEKSNQNRIMFTLDNYNWNFTTYINLWAQDLRKWWRAPSDYISGKYPQGGSVWVRVKITTAGELVEYKIFHSQVSEEMQLKIVQSLISSFDRNQLPESFFGKEVIVNWQFIYPPFGKSFDPEK